MYATTLKIAVEIICVCLCAGERAKKQITNKSTPRRETQREINDAICKESLCLGDFVLQLC